MQNKRRVIKKQRRRHEGRTSAREKDARVSPRFIVHPMDSFRRYWTMHIGIRDTPLIKSRLCLALFMHGYILGVFLFFLFLLSSPVQFLFPLFTLACSFPFRASHLDAINSSFVKIICDRLLNGENVYGH